jgi:hypothetical protein
VPIGEHEAGRTESREPRLTAHPGATARRRKWTGERIFGVYADRPSVR